MKRILWITVISAFLSITVVSYTSWWQIQQLGWLRALIYLEINDESPCEAQHQGYGRLYKHGCFVNPVSVVQSVDHSIDKVHRGVQISDEEEFELLRAVEFLREWANEGKHNDEIDFLIAPYQFSWPYYGLDAGWVSGMAQGHIIEAMVAAFEVTKDKDYLDTAKLFANAFYVPVEAGGVTVQTEFGPWFEEYAQADVEPSFALNGHIFAIEGLYRLAHYLPEYKELVYKSVSTTEDMIDHFNAGWWSRYDLRGTMANQKYHHIHIMQLHWLGMEFGSEKLHHHAQDFIWSQLSPFSSILRFLTAPSRFLGFILALNYIFIIISLWLFCMFYIKLRKHWK